MTERDVDWVRREYNKIRQKHSLPSFEEMNNEFEIERMLERDTALFIRRLRRTVLEKVLHFLKLVEYMLNPQSAPLFIHSILKGISKETGKIVEKLYEEGCKMEMRSFALDVSSTEEQEVAFIKELLIKWPDMKKDIEKINIDIDKSWSVKSESDNRRKFLVG